MSDEAPSPPKPGKGDIQPTPSEVGKGNARESKKASTANDSTAQQMVQRADAALQRDDRQLGELAAALSASQEQIPPGVHRTRMDDSTTLLRFGKRFPGGGEAEYDALTKLYNADPLHVVRPIQLNRDETQQVTGYDAEEAPGESVEERILRGEKLTPNIAKQIRAALQGFHARRLVHGDPNPGNIIITPEGTVKFVDPVGYGEISPEDLQQYIDFDQNALSWLTDWTE